MFQRSTKGASKQRRDWINTEINIIKDNLPVGENVRRRLSQLQVMALCKAYIAKTNCFQNTISENATVDNCFDFSEALSGFLMVLTTDGKLLYVSENVTQILGHSMVDLMTQVETVYEIIDHRDQKRLKDFLTAAMCGMLTENPPAELSFTCRTSLGKLIRKNNVFDRQKSLSIRGRMIWPGAGLFLTQPIFVASCSPVLSCSTNENTAIVDTTIYNSCHSLDMKYLHLDQNGECHLGGSVDDFKYQSWYELIHPDDIDEAARKHKQLIDGGFDTAKSLCMRVQTRYGHFIWLHVVMRLVVPLGVDNTASEIVCINHVISEWEALEIQQRERIEEEHARFNTATSCYSEMRHNMAAAYDCKPFLPTIVVDDGFLDQMTSSPSSSLSSSDELMKPVDFNRQALMQKLRRKATEGGRARCGDNKRAKYDNDSSLATLDLILDDCSSGNTGAAFNRSLYNAVFDESVSCPTTRQHDSHATVIKSQPRVAVSLPQTRNFLAADLTTVDMMSFVPLTPPSSVMSAESLIDECYPASFNDDCIVTSFPAPFSHSSSSSSSSVIPPVSAASYTPPYSPPNGFSSFEEYQPINHAEDDEFSFFEGYQPMTKMSRATPPMPVVPVANNSGRRDDLPELPVCEIESFFDSVECNLLKLYDQIISSPRFPLIVDDMMSSDGHGYQLARN